MMKDRPFRPIHPTLIIYPILVFVIIAIAALGTENSTAGLVILLAVIIGGAFWERGYQSAQWTDAAEWAGLRRESTQLSGTYLGRSVVVPIDSSPFVEDASDYIHRMLITLRQDKAGEFVLAHGKATKPESNQLGEAHLVLKSDPPDFVRRVFSTSYLQRRLYDTRPLYLNRLELKNSSLIFDYTDIPISRLQEALEIASEIADAVERTPLAASGTRSDAASVVTNEDRDTG